MVTQHNTKILAALPRCGCRNMFNQRLAHLLMCRSALKSVEPLHNDLSSVGLRCITAFTPQLNLLHPNHLPRCSYGLTVFFPDDMSSSRVLQGGWQCTLLWKATCLFAITSAVTPQEASCQLQPSCLTCHCFNLATLAIKTRYDVTIRCNQELVFERERG
jgi:hypothetical protein